MTDFDSVFVRNAWKIMEGLHSASSSMAGLSACLDILCEALACDQGTVWIEDKCDQLLYVMAERGTASHTGSCLEKGRGAVGKVVETGQSLLLSSRDADSVLSAEERDIGLAEGALMWVPLRTVHGVLGCIQLGRGDHAFTAEEQQLCERCGGIIALDIEDKGIDAFPERHRHAILTLRNISRAFKADDRTIMAVDRISLDIYEKELLVILGESGSGKSTLLNLIGCMDRPTSGQILVDGADFSSPTEKEMTEYRRSFIGFVFQSYNLMPTLTAVENVRFIAENSDEPMPAEDAISLVGLKDRADHFPSALSGGQQQRVAIARALVKSPRLILADEPTAALDYETGKEVLQALQAAVRERDTALVMVTHNAEIAKIGNRVIRMRNGKIVSVYINPNPLPAAELSW